MTVGALVGAKVGAFVGEWVGASVSGAAVGALVGVFVGVLVGGGVYRTVTELSLLYFDLVVTTTHENVTAVVPWSVNVWDISVLGLGLVWQMPFVPLLHADAICMFEPALIVAKPFATSELSANPLKVPPETETVNDPPELEARSTPPELTGWSFTLIMKLPAP